jgi:hypothetical protein
MAKSLENVEAVEVSMDAYGKQDEMRRWHCVTWESYQPLMIGIDMYRSLIRQKF